MLKCAFNHNHQMPVVRYPWHLPRCPDRKLRRQLGLPSYHCPNNWYHIFLSERDLEHHQVICSSGPLEAKPANSLQQVDNKEQTRKPFSQKSLCENSSLMLLSSNRLLGKRTAEALNQSPDSLAREVAEYEAAKENNEPTHEPSKEALARSRDQRIKNKKAALELARSLPRKPN